MRPHPGVAVGVAEEAEGEAARLAAVLPSPRKRRPQRMDEYTARILERMGQMGW